ncbi:XRE family transcriptional regulator [Nocardiopsis gilva YIM 90087]|uniref:XRE family transcriptional regulator n=1 Tax=Nocardiopsis gilva YIM 90087 TaxID=1235441 RepID=A0A223S0G4_9ACTN|nr:helix-turn-helix transcriptional regulator [Nocardiopsis gilva]ASU81587.1 XRE family transcriptional regulator [Nocardiopsis gilva YIM 90087]
MISSPTLRRRRLSRRLRELRDRKGWTARQVADEAKKRSGRPRGWSDSKVIRLERGEWKRLRVDDVRVLLDIYDVTDLDEIAACEHLAKEANQKGWWATFDDVLGSGQFVGLETEASQIRTYQPAAIPGLLQTEDYVRAVIRSDGVDDETEVERRVAARMLRQQLLTRSTPPAYHAVIDEAALLRVTSQLRGQLQHLLDVGMRDNLDIQVLPIDRGPHAAMTGQFVIMDFPSPDPPIVYLETLSEEIYLEKVADIQRYQQIYDFVRTEALPLDESREIIQNLLISRNQDATNA